MAAACREHSARLARGSLPGARSTARPYRGPPGNARQDQARASLAVKERTSLMLDRLCSALLTIVDTLPGLHARALLLVDFAAARARPRAPNISNYARHSDGVEFFPALGQDRSGRAPQRSAGGRSHRSLPGQSSTPGSLLRQPRACSSGNLAAAFAAPSEGRQVEACASTLPSWLRRFNRTDRPAMNRARWV